MDIVMGRSIGHVGLSPAEASRPNESTAGQPASRKAPGSCAAQIARISDYIRGLSPRMAAGPANQQRQQIIQHGELHAHRAAAPRTTIGEDR
jgi:hypothetical protein